MQLTTGLIRALSDRPRKFPNSKPNRKT